MKIRKATIHDAQSLSTLALSLGEYYGDDDPSGISPFFREKITVEAFEKYLSNQEAYEYYIYEKQGKIIGCFSLLNATHFFHLFVDADHHREGIGKALVEYVLKQRDHKLYSVNSSLYAVPFYKKIGFVPTALVQNHNGMTYQPMVWDRKQ